MRMILVAYFIIVAIVFVVLSVYDAAKDPSKDPLKVAGDSFFMAIVWPVAFVVYALCVPAWVGAAIGRRRGE